MFIGFKEVQSASNEAGGGMSENSNYFECIDYITGHSICIICQDNHWHWNLRQISWILCWTGFEGS